MSMSVNSSALVVSAPVYHSYTMAVPLTWIKEPMPPGGYLLRRKRLRKKRNKYEARLRRAADYVQRKIERDIIEAVFSRHNTGLSGGTPSAAAIRSREKS